MLQLTKKSLNSYENLRALQQHDAWRDAGELVAGYLSQHPGSYLE